MGQDGLGWAGGSRILVYFRVLPGLLGTQGHRAAGTAGSVMRGLERGSQLVPQGVNRQVNAFQWSCSEYSYLFDKALWFCA